MLASVSRGSALPRLRRRQMTRTKGYAYHVPLANLPIGDTQTAQHSSTLMLFEDAMELGSDHSLHAEIELAGGGRYSHWEHGLFFSSSDNSSPIGNGRSYHVLFPAQMFLRDAESPERILGISGNNDAQLNKKTPSIIIELSVYEIRADLGFSYQINLPTIVPSGDDVNDQARSPLRLFESGVELGPTHSNHDDIRNVGGGRYSHAGAALWFSTRDNSSPLTNRRTYQVLVPSGMFLGGRDHPVIRAPLASEVISLSDLQRFDLA